MKWSCRRTFDRSGAVSSNIRVMKVRISPSIFSHACAPDPGAEALSPVNYRVIQS